MSLWVQTQYNIMSYTTPNNFPLPEEELFHSIDSDMASITAPTLRHPDDLDNYIPYSKSFNQLTPVDSVDDLLAKIGQQQCEQRQSSGDKLQLRPYDRYVYNESSESDSDIDELQSNTYTFIDQNNSSSYVNVDKLFLEKSATENCLSYSQKTKCKALRKRSFSGQKMKRFFSFLLD